MKHLLFNKYMLIALAASPLGYITYQTFVRSAEAHSLSTVLASSMRADALKQEIESNPPKVLLSTNSQNLEVVAAVLTIAEGPVAESANRTPLEIQLANAESMYANTLGEVGELFREYAALKTGAALPVIKPFGNGHPFQAVYERRYQVVMSENEIRTLRTTRPEESAQARQMLEEYIQLPGASKSFYQLEHAEIAGYEARYLKKLELEQLLNDYFQDKVAETTLLQIRRTVESRIDLLAAYLNKYREVGTYTEWAQQDLERWQAALQFLRTHDEVKRLTLSAQVERFDKLVKNAPDSKAVLEIASRSIQGVCNANLPLQLPLDKRVYVLETPDSLEEAELVERSSIVVVWEDKQMEWFPEVDFDEYSMPIDRVRRLIIDGQGTRRPMLKGSMLSDAAHTYNVARGSLAWTPSEIARLAELCKPYQQHLGETWQRLTEIRQLSEMYPKFFGPATTSNAGS